MSTVAVIDYGMGNLHSASKAVMRVAPDVEVLVTSNPEVVAGADRVIFPGVGAIGDCMTALRELGLDEAIADIFGRRPLLAICVGMQALMERSEENHGVACLGLMPGVVSRFPAELRAAADEPLLKVPHMGWNQVRQAIAHPLWRDIEADSRFYFVHSYCVQDSPAERIAGQCHYGVPFAAALAADKVFATQFHPEKSQRDGLQLLKNFMEWDGAREC